MSRYCDAAALNDLSSAGWPIDIEQEVAENHRRQASHDRQRDLPAREASNHLDRCECGGGEQHRCDQVPDEGGAAERLKRNVTGERGPGARHKVPGEHRQHGGQQQQIHQSARLSVMCDQQRGAQEGRQREGCLQCSPRSRVHDVNGVKRPQHCGECAYDRDRGRPERPRLQLPAHGDGVELMTVYFPIHTASTRQRRAGSGRACRSSPDRALCRPILGRVYFDPTPTRGAPHLGLIYNIFYSTLFDMYLFCQPSTKG